MAKKRYRIAIVSNTSWSIYNFRLGLIRRLKSVGFEVVVIAPKDNFSANLIAEGFNYHHVALNNYSYNPLSNFLVIRDLYRLYKQHDIDFVLHYTIKPNIYGSLAAAFLKIPSIALITGVGQLFAFGSPFLQTIILKMYQLALHFSREVWFLNEYDRTSFVEKGLVPDEKTDLLPSEGVNVNWFLPRSAALPNRYETNRFIFIGRLIREKGISDFIETARLVKRKYPKSEFQILGFIDPNNPHSVTPEEIETWQREGLICYLGETTDIRPYLAQADCLLFPSFYREGISRVCLEAASMQKPIITTDNVGCRDVVAHNITGFICPKHNPIALANAVEAFIDLSPDEKKKMGQQARLKVLREFDEEHIIEHYFMALKRLIPTEFLPQKLIKHHGKTAEFARH